MKAYEIDLKKLKRYAIKDRLNKVSVRQFAPPPPPPRSRAKKLVKMTVS